MCRKVFLSASPLLHFLPNVANELSFKFAPRNTPIVYEERVRRMLCFLRFRDKLEAQRVYCKFWRSFNKLSVQRVAFYQKPRLLWCRRDAARRSMTHCWQFGCAAEAEKVQRAVSFKPIISKLIASPAKRTLWDREEVVVPQKLNHHGVH